MTQSNLAIWVIFLRLCAVQFRCFISIYGTPSNTLLASPIDCTFELKGENAGNNGFCGWRPDNEGGTRIWHSGNAVLVDSVNSVVRSSSAGERFAFAQGRFGAPTEGALRSPLIHDRLRQNRLFRLTYWKASASPSLDICLEEMAEEPLHCVDTIQGPGQQQWVRRSVELPAEERPYRVVLRARNLLAAEDIIGIDDVQLLEADGENQLEKSLGPKNPFELVDEVADGEEEEEHRTRIFPASKNQIMNGKNTGKKLKTDEIEAEQIRPTLQPLIRPQIRLSPSLQQIGTKNTEQLETKFADLQRPPMLANGVGNVGGQQFPSFPSFFNPILTPTTPHAPIMERNERCHAVSCTFMENTCQWELGPGWHSTSHGSTSIESPATSSRLASAQFKPPVASYVDFDLWMSDEADLSVFEQIVEDGPKMEEIGAGGQQLFSRSGATDGGWHRFRVPLHPSFSPVRLLFMAQLSAPQNAFISLSNIRLVNSEGAEIGCQSVGDKSTTTTTAFSPSLFSIDSKGAKEHQSDHRAMLAELGLDWLARQPAPLQLPSSALGGGGLFPSPPPFPIGDPSTLLATQQQAMGRPEGTPPRRLHHQPQHLPPAGTVPFNPLRPMFEGIAPIVPLQGNPPRLTAVMDEPANRQKQNNFPQLLSPLTFSTTESTVAKPMARLRQMPADELEEEKSGNKFELDEPNDRQQLYGATPISTGISPGGEALLPFQGDGKEGVGGTEDNDNKAFSQKENSELTMLPRRRNKMLHTRPTENDADDWPNMMEMGGGAIGGRQQFSGKKSSSSSLPSSVTSVLASSHHRGWVENAGMGEELTKSSNEFRARRSGLGKN